MALLFQNEPLDQFPDNTQQKHGYCNGIDGMHYLQIKTGWPVGIFFSEKVHVQIYREKVKAESLKQKGRKVVDLDSI